jgi:hypothetical protein
MALGRGKANSRPQAARKFAFRAGPSELTGAAAFIALQGAPAAAAFRRPAAMDQTSPAALVAVMGAVRFTPTS